MAAVLNRYWLYFVFLFLIQGRSHVPKGPRGKSLSPSFKRNVHVLFIFIIYIHIYEELLQAHQSTDLRYFPATRQQLNTFLD